jgi:hypothetical protein
MLWQAISNARIPEVQFWLTETALLRSGNPTRLPTCRAGSEPCIPPYNWPMQISSIWSAGTPDRSMAPLAAVIARSRADTSLSVPMNLPIAVRAALTITTSWRAISDSSTMRGLWLENFTSQSKAYLRRLSIFPWTKFDSMIYWMMMV